MINPKKFKYQIPNRIKKSEIGLSVPKILKIGRFSAKGRALPFPPKKQTTNTTTKGDVIIYKNGFQFPI